MNQNSLLFHITIALAFAFLTPAAFCQTPEPTGIIPTSERTPATWRSTLQRPANNDWRSATFDDASWKQAPAPFGTPNTPGITPNRTSKTNCML